jgi:hypothetical protein
MPQFYQTTGLSFDRQSPDAFRAASAMAWTAQTSSSRESSPVNAVGVHGSRLTCKAAAKAPFGEEAKGDILLFIVTAAWYDGFYAANCKGLAWGLCLPRHQSRKQSQRRVS